MSPAPSPEPPALDVEALRRRADGPAAARILGAALAAVDPAAALRRQVTLDAAALVVGEHRLPLGPSASLWCIAVGKAAVPMARAAQPRLALRLAGGVVVTKHAPTPGTEAGALPVIEGDHPVPDARSEAAGMAVLEVLDRVAPDDVVVVLLSGGASSLMVAPAPGLALSSLRTLGRALVHSGASIEEINAVRARLDRLKGGGLARRAAPARVVTLVLDDVIDAPLHVVGSGPTRPLPPDGPSALAVLERHRIEVPAPVRRRLAAPAPPPPAPGPLVRLAGNDTAVAAAEAAATATGWHVRRLPRLTGEARAQGRALALTLARARPDAPTAWLGGGETTVTVRGPGRGGRNQELALAAMEDLAGTRGRLLVTLATDGEDGPTDAAGAVVDGASLDRARALGLDPARHLAANDAYPVFEGLSDLLRIGPTGTNVCDLVLGLVRP